LLPGPLARLARRERSPGQRLVAAEEAAGVTGRVIVAQRVVPAIRPAGPVRPGAVELAVAVEMAAVVGVAQPAAVVQRADPAHSHHPVVSARARRLVDPDEPLVRVRDVTVAVQVDAEKLDAHRGASDSRGVPGVERRSTRLSLGPQLVQVRHVRQRDRGHPLAVAVAEVRAVLVADRAGRADRAMERRGVGGVVDRDVVVRVHGTEDLVATTKHDLTLVVREVRVLREALLHDAAAPDGDAATRIPRYGDDRTVHTVLAARNADRAHVYGARHARNRLTRC